MSARDAGLPLEDFIHALTSQLDRAQSAMALKARAGLPLTFAVKDISIDLRTHVDMVGSVVRIRPAGPGDAEASTIHLQLTTITRPMIEENTFQVAASKQEPSLKEAAGESLTEEDQRRLEWAGVHTLTQLRALREQSGDDAIERVAQVPAQRLRMALERADHPRLTQILAVTAPSGAAFLRIDGHNLMSATGRAPEVRIAGEVVKVLEASPRSLLVAPAAHQYGGVIVVETSPGRMSQLEFDAHDAAPRTPVETGGAT